MRKIIGTVSSTKMQKTLVVTVDRYKSHPKYKKRYKASKKFYADCSNSAEYNVGDTVEIQETRPLSKLKRWRVLQKLTAATITSELKEDAEPAKEAK